MKLEAKAANEVENAIHHPKFSCSERKLNWNGRRERVESAQNEDILGKKVEAIINTTRNGKLRIAVKCFLFPRL